MARLVCPYCCDQKIFHIFLSQRRSIKIQFYFLISFHPLFINTYAGSLTTLYLIAMQASKLANIRNQVKDWQSSSNIEFVMVNIEKNINEKHLLAIHLSMNKKQAVAANYSQPIKQNTMIRMNALLLCIAFLITAAANAQNTGNVNNYYADSSLFRIDSTINNIIIDDQPFFLQVLRDKFDEQLTAFTAETDPSFTQSPITLVFSNSSTGKIVYSKKFDFEPGDYPYLNYSFYKAQDQPLNNKGKLYVTFNKSYGGSGSQSTTYYIHFNNGNITFSNLFNSSGELSYIVYHKNDNEIIVLDGIWNMQQNESHFANHRYKITRYLFTANGFEKKTIGHTKFKYASLDEDKTAQQILKDIKTKEPLLLKGIQPANFK